MSTNDNHHDSQSMTPLPDPHGHAALLLVESLLHSLQERSVLSIADAIGVVATALDVQTEVAETADGASAPMWRSHALLSSIMESLKHDGDGGAPPRTKPRPVA